MSDAGIRFEGRVLRWVREGAERDGVLVDAFRCAGSHGCADVVVRNADGTDREYVTVQCKKHGKLRYGRA